MENDTFEELLNEHGIDPPLLAGEAPIIVYGRVQLVSERADVRVIHENVDLWVSNFRLLFVPWSPPRCLPVAAHAGQDLSTHASLPVRGADQLTSLTPAKGVLGTMAAAASKRGRRKKRRGSAPGATTSVSPSPLTLSTSDVTMPTDDAAAAVGSSELAGASSSSRRAVSFMPVSVPTRLVFQFSRKLINGNTCAVIKLLTADVRCLQVTMDMAQFRPDLRIVAGGESESASATAAFAGDDQLAQMMAGASVHSRRSGGESTATVSQALFQSRADEIHALLVRALNLQAPGSLSSLFAFTHKSNTAAVCYGLDERADRIDVGWRLYDEMAEYHRMGVPDDGWKIVDWNRQYDLCDSYPSLVVVPRETSRSQILASAGFRDERRFPVFSWKCKGFSQVLLRSSQPLVGLGRAKCEADQRLLSMCRAAGSLVPLPSDTDAGSRNLIVLDARPQVNAIGNQARALAAFTGGGTATGGGYEGSDMDPESYKDCTVQFLNVENIQAVSKSWMKLFDLCTGNEKKIRDQANFFGDLNNTDWMKHISSVLSAALRTVKLIREGFSVLVHCSHGWDRTTQILSLAQLILDPYYRTYEGFQILIEKEWCAFGHRFAQRLGHDEGLQRQHSEAAPIFIQWLECVQNLLKQEPVAFEFSEELLIFLADQSQCCQFGTFLCNSQLERRKYALSQRTCSVWSFVNDPENRLKFTNVIYSHERNQRNSLTLSSFVKNLSFWSGFYLRFDPLASSMESLQDHIFRLLANQDKGDDAAAAAAVNGDAADDNDPVFGSPPPHSPPVPLTITAALAADGSHRVTGAAAAGGGGGSARRVRLNSSPSSNLVVTSLSHSRPMWVPDVWCTACSGCGSRFVAFKRKHHCRACGNVFCAGCSANRRPLPSLKYFEPVRVCDGCARKDGLL